MHLIYYLYKFIYKISLIFFTKKTVNFLKRKRILKFKFINDKFIYKNSDLAYSFLYNEISLAGGKTEFNNFNYSLDHFSKENLYILHSFDWLQHLKVIDSSLASEKIYELLNTWIHNYSNCDCKIAFSLPVLAVRLFNLLTSERILIIKNKKFKIKLLESISLQVRIFLKLYDFTKSNQSLIINSSLFVVGKALNSRKLVDISLNGILNFLNNKVLADGGIYDKSPSDTLYDLEKLLFIYKNLDNKEAYYKNQIRPYVDRIIIFIKSVSYKDGSLGVFNGGYEEDRNKISFLLSLGSLNAYPFKNLRYSGYLNLTSGEKIDLLLKTNYNFSNKVKKNAYDGNSILSNEIIIQGKRVFVNNSTNKTLESIKSNRNSYSSMLFFDRNNTLINMPSFVKEQDCKIVENSTNELNKITATYKGLKNTYGIIWYKTLILSKKYNFLLGEELLTFNPDISLIKGAILKFILHPGIVIKKTNDSLLLLNINNEEWIFKSNRIIILNDELYKGIKNEIYPTVSLNIPMNKNTSTIEWSLVQNSLYNEKIRPFILKNNLIACS